MPDYSKGKIYTIRNRDDDTKIYVGSTIQPLAVRLGGHKCDSKKEINKNSKLYIEVNNNWSNWYIELYENYSCSSREELHKREGEVIRLIGTLNKLIAGRNIKEYCEENKEKIKEQKTKYRIENIDKIKEHQKQYRDDNKEKINEKHRTYYYNNQEKINEKHRTYYHNNQEIILEKITCECGCKVIKNKLIRHKKTKKHFDLINLKTD